MEGSESPQQALEREIREELGIIAQVNDLITAKTMVFKDKKPYLILFYTCQTSYESEPEGCKYFRARDIPAIRGKIISGDLPIIDELIRRYS